MFIESRKENDILFKKITQVIESAEMPDGDEILSLFEISRNPPQIVTSVQKISSEPSPPNSTHNYMKQRT